MPQNLLPCILPLSIGRSSNSSREVMDMTHFSPEAQRVLETNGWREDRRIDTSEYERALLAAGYDDCQPACDFLQHYGDLEVDAGVGDTCLNTLMSEIMKIRLVPCFFCQEAGRTLYII